MFELEIHRGQERHRRNAVAELVRVLEHDGCSCDYPEFCIGCGGHYDTVNHDMDGESLSEALDAIRGAFDL